MFVILTIFVFCIGIILSIFNKPIITIIWLIIWCNYAVNASLSIFLMLRINKNIYGCLCKICHLQFKKLCNNLVDNTVTANLQITKIEPGSKIDSTQTTNDQNV